MNREKAMEWVAALRSGQYTQAQGYLRTAQGFCCLGVACELHKDQVQGTWDRVASEYYSLRQGDGNYNTTVMPDRIMEFMGLHDSIGMPWSDYSNGVVIAGKTYNSLAQANDAGVSFAQIANWIEANWEKL